MRGKIVMSVGNVVALLAVIVVNYLANAIPFNGQTTGEISDKFDVLFKPAGYVFAIWGAIYLGLLAFAIYQVLPSQRESGLLDKIGWYFILSCLANAVWLYFWHYEHFLLTVAIMLVLLYSLITLYLRLNIGNQPVQPTMRWLVQVPFSIYLGWISVATIANVTIFFASIDWNGFGIAPTVWFAVVLLAGLALALLMSWQRRDIAYGLVIIWAFVGVAVQNAGTSASMLSWSAAVLSVVMVVAGRFLAR
ncbi:MAG: tryptophan-rich sensory protein [Deferribacteres bacterium]|nr:tryptophan-rich sensory protein [candidate division KSB1 bacterium]MCB9508780.1 tryptophan-rich sensory protein [Deferribacteres bacterium]